MSEERVLYGADTNPVNCDTLTTQTHSNFVEIRTRKGRLIFRLDPERMLVDWREGRDTELIDLKPYLT